MKPEEIDRAIAEHLGWQLVPLYGREFNGIPVMVWKRPDGERGFPCPCYSTDLNAMHEAEETLKTHGELNAYRMALGGDVSAKAARRAIAFLHVIGKWRIE